MNPTIIALLLAYVVFPLLFVLMEKFWFSLPDRKILRSGFGSDVIWYGFQSFVSQRLAPLVGLLRARACNLCVRDDNGGVLQRLWACRAAPILVAGSARLCPC